MDFEKSSIWISGPQIVPYEIKQNVFNSKSTLQRGEAKLIPFLNTKGINFASPYCSMGKLLTPCVVGFVFIIGEPMNSEMFNNNKT